MTHVHVVVVRESQSHTSIYAFEEPEDKRTLLIHGGTYDYVMRQMILALHDLMYGTKLFETHNKRHRSEKEHQEFCDHIYDPVYNRVQGWESAIVNYSIADLKRLLASIEIADKVDENRGWLSGHQSQPSQLDGIEKLIVELSLRVDALEKETKKADGTKSIKSTLDREAQRFLAYRHDDADALAFIIEQAKETDAYKLVEFINAWGEGRILDDWWADWESFCRKNPQIQRQPH